MELIILQRKASILRKAADVIELEGLSWHEFRGCVIGKIGAVILGNLESRDIHIIQGSRSWTSISEQYPICPDTGVSISDIITALSINGFSREDIMRAEFKTEENYLLSEHYSYSNCESGESVVERLRKWASEIDFEVLLSRLLLSECL